MGSINDVLISGFLSVISNKFLAPTKKLLVIFSPSPATSSINIMGTTLPGPYLIAYTKRVQQLRHWVILAWVVLAAFGMWQGLKLLNAVSINMEAPSGSQAAEAEVCVCVMCVCVCMCVCDMCVCVCVMCVCVCVCVCGMGWRVLFE